MKILWSCDSNETGLATAAAAAAGAAVHLARISWLTSIFVKGRPQKSITINETLLRKKQRRMFADTTSR